MDDLVENTKKYWPYALGAVIGVGIIIYFNRGSSSGGSDNAYASLAAAQSAGSASNQQFALQKAQLDSQMALADKQLTISAMKAQGETAAQLAGAAGTVISALNAPSVAAINAAAAENVATINSSVLAASAGYMAQAQMVTAAGQASQGFAAALAQQAAVLGQASVASTMMIPAQQQALRPVVTQGADAEWAGLAATAVGAYFGVPI